MPFLVVIPTDDEIAKSCPVALIEEQVSSFAAWRAEFPRQAASATPTPQPEAGSGSGPQPSLKTAEPGTQVSDAAKLKEDFGDAVVSEKPLPAGGNASITLALVEHTAAVGAQKCLRVWLHNLSAKNISLLVATFLGQGGQGSFVSLVIAKPDEDHLKRAWRYTRLTGYKKDNAELANGYMIFNKEGKPLEGKPKLSHLADVEKEIGTSVALYGHAITRGGAKVTITPSPSPVVWMPGAPAVGGGGSGAADFSCDTLGQYIQTHEDTSGLPKCLGLARPVFEYKTNQASPELLQPGAPPGKSSCWLFSTKKIEVLAGGFTFLG